MAHGEQGIDPAEWLGTFAKVWTGDEPGGSDENLVETPDRFAAIEQVLAAVQERGSIVVVGEPGVGKSEVARAAAHRLRGEGWTVFEASSSDLIADQRYIGEIEGRVATLAQLGRQHRLLWLLPSMHEALSMGVFENNPHGLLSRAMPHILARDVVVVGESSPGEWSTVTERLAGVGGAIEVARLAEPSRDETRRIVLGWSRQKELEVPDAVVDETIDLAEEHQPNRRAPAAPISLLEAVRVRRLAGAADLERVITRSDVIEALCDRTGLPPAIIDAEAPLDLDGVRDFFAGRILGQPEAVDLVVKRVAMIKAGLTDPTRPLGVFAFAGPTGTGKTEMAKTLALWLFGSAEKLLRLDMSEMQTPESVAELLAPAAPGSGGLLAEVRASPFSVVLLDEFEKSHPRVWDLFLQVFDDGRLSDAAGMVADFRQCVVILTTNLGAERAWPTRLGFGASSSGFNPAVIERAVANAFRPEFLNRLDRLVVFNPLGREIMRGLVQKEMRDVLQRRGLRNRPWAVELDDSAIELLLELGFNAEMGARPLKRALEEHLLAPLAEAIVRRSVPTGDQFLFVRSSDGRRIDVEFIDPDFGVVRSPDEPERRDERDPRAIALEATGKPREREALANALAAIRGIVGSAEWSETKEELLRSMSVPDFWEARYRFAILSEAELRDRIEAGTVTAEHLRDRLIRASTDAAARRICRMLALRIYVLDIALEALRRREPQDAYLAIRAADREATSVSFAAEVAAMYRSWAEARGMRLETLRPGGPGSGSEVLGVSGFGAHQILADESGRHIREPTPETGAGAAVEVAVAAQPLEAAQDERGKLEQALRSLEEAGGGGRVVRRYRPGSSPLVRDAVRGWRTGRLERVLSGEFDLL